MSACELFFSIEMPLTKEGMGPARSGEVHTISWRVWDQALRDYGGFDTEEGATKVAKMMDEAVKNWQNT